MNKLDEISGYEVRKARLNVASVSMQSAVLKIESVMLDLNCMPHVSRSISKGKQGHGASMIHIWQEYTVLCFQTLRKSLHAVNKTIEFIPHTGSKNLFEISHIPLFELLRVRDHRDASETRYYASRGVSVRGARRRVSGDEDIRGCSFHSLMFRVLVQRGFSPSNHRGYCD